MRTRTRTILAGLALAAALIGGVAWATIPGSGGTIQGCYNTGNGNLRVVESADECRNSETAISWNHQGQTGATGANGTNGVDGEDGAAGTNGTNGIDGKDGQPGTNGTNGVDGAPGAPGDPCLPDDRACVGPKGDTGAIGPQGPAGTAGTIAIQHVDSSQTPTGNSVTGGAWEATIGIVEPYWRLAVPLRVDCPDGYKALDGSFSTTPSIEPSRLQEEDGPASGIAADSSGFVITAFSVTAGRASSTSETPPTVTFDLKVRCIGIQ